MWYPFRRRAQVVDDDETLRDERHARRRRLTQRLIAFTIFVQLCAFVLELIPALSTPIIKNLYIANIQAKRQPGQPVTAVATQIRVGVWGFCAFSALDTANLLGTNGDCIGPQLGYTLDPSIIQLVTNQVSLVDSVLKGVTIILVLHPITAALSFITLVLALFLSNHALSIFCLISAVITGLVGGVSLATDLAIAIIAKNKVPDLSNNTFTVAIGNAVWMMVAAWILTWIAVILISVRACVCWGIGRRHYRKY